MRLCKHNDVLVNEIDDRILNICENTHHAKGYCKKHYMQKLRGKLFNPQENMDANKDVREIKEKIL